MDVYFQDKLASARQLAKNKRPKVGSSMGSPASVLTGLPVGFGNVATNQVLPWPVFQQPVQQQFHPVQSGLPPNLLPLQPVQSRFMQNMPQAYSNTVPNQNPYQQSYGSQGSSRPYSYNRFSRQGKIPGIVCFICEERGHIAWDCPQKKFGQPFRRTDTGGEKS